MTFSDYYTRTNVRQACQPDMHEIAPCVRLESPTLAAAPWTSSELADFAAYSGRAGQSGGADRAQ
jgi:hypothetical protein